MINIHLYPSDFSCETRIEKQAKSINKIGFFTKIFLIGLAPPKNNLNQWSIDDTVSVRLVGQRFSNFSIFGKFLSIASYYINTYKLIKDYDVGCINAHSLSVLPFCVFLARKVGAKLIYDTHELETETNSISGLRKILSKLTESIFIKYADHVFVVGEEISQWYGSTYQIKKPTVILNSPNFTTVSKSEYFRSKFNLNNEQIICLYLGSLSKGRGVSNLCKSFMTFGDNNIVIVFMGTGDLKDYVLDCEKKCSRIFYHDPVPTTEVVKFSSSADVGISLVENTCLSHFYSMPNKVFEYLFSSLPVVVSNMRETASFVERYSIGEVLADDSHISLRSAILKVTNEDFDMSGISRVIRETCWERQEEKMLLIYRDLLIRANQ